MNNKNNENKNDKKFFIILGIVIGLIIIGIGAVIYFSNLNKEDSKKDEKELAYTEVITKLSDGEVEKIEMTVGSTAIKVKLKNVEEEKNAIIPNTQAFIELLQEKVAAGNDIE